MIQDEKILIRFIKKFSGIFANRVKNVKIFTSYSGGAFLLHPKIKEVISMIMVFKQDTRISLCKRMAAAPLRPIWASHIVNQNFFKLTHFKSCNLNLPPKQGVL